MLSKFKFGSVVGIVFSLLILSVAAISSAANYSKASGGRIEVTVSQPETWKPLIIGPEKPIVIPKLPQKIGFYTSGDMSVKAMKPFIVLRDAEGMEYGFLFSMLLYAGYRENTVAGAEGLPGRGGPVDFSHAKPPFTFHGFIFYCRKPLPESTIYFDNITVDGKLIEGFDEDNGWKVKEKPERTQCVVRLVQEGGPGVLAEVFPKRRENLIANSGLEEGTEGWEYAKAEYIPKDFEGKAIASVKEHGGKYKWEDEGVESLHSISMEVDTPGKWAGIFTKVKDIRPNTTYVLTFAHRMSQPSGFFLSIFGKHFPIMQMLEENPEQWTRFTKAFNSRSCQGDVSLGFYVKAGDKPIKIGIDEVEMYEGFSPIGYDLARLHLLYYNHTYVSPDVALPSRFQMETLFSDRHVPKEFSYVFELPEEISWEGFWCRWNFWSGLKEAMSQGKLSQEPIEIEGKKYTRYSFTLPLKRGSRYRRYFVRVSERDTMSPGGCRGGSLGSGRKTFTVFLGTKEKEGEFPGYYYARWPAGQQPKRKFFIKVVRVDKIKPFKRFEANLYVYEGDVEYGPQFSEQMKSLGIEGFTCHRRDAGAIRIAQKAGIKRFSQFMNIPNFNKEASGTDPDGNKYGQYCLSYRGKCWKKGMAALKRNIDHGFTDFILDDPAGCTCYCDKCRNTFEYFLSAYTKLPYQDPRDFINSGDERYITLWKEFPAWHYGMAAKAMLDELQAYAGDKYPGRRVLIAACACTDQDSVQHSFAFDGMKRALGYLTGQYYINHYIDAYQGSPIRIGNRMAATYQKMGKYAPTFMPLFGPGCDFPNPFNSLDPHALMKYQMLEAAFAVPMAGYHMYSATDIDGGDLKYMAEFNKLVSEHEDMIIDGKAVSGVSCIGTSRSSARLKELNGKYLLLVADYSTYKDTPTTVKVTLPFAPKAKLKDVETGEIAARLRGNTKTFEVTLGKSRARVFSFE